MNAIRLFAVVVAGLAGLVLVAPPAPAAACSCGGKGAKDAKSDAGAAFGRADAAFVGTFIYRNDPLAAEANATGERIVLNHFEIEKVNKGDLGTSVDVAAPADESSCGLPAQPGGRLGVLLTAIPGGWKSDLCNTLPPNQMVAASKGPFLSGELLLTVLAVLALGCAVTGVAMVAQKQRGTGL